MSGKAAGGTKCPVDEQSSFLAALRSWLLTSEPSPISLCKPFSCKAYPGKLGHSTGAELQHSGTTRPFFLFSKQPKTTVLDAPAEENGRITFTTRKTRIPKQKMLGKILGPRHHGPRGICKETLRDQWRLGRPLPYQLFHLFFCLYPPSTLPIQVSGDIFHRIAAS